MKSNALDEILKELENRPFYEKWWSRFIFLKWDIISLVRFHYLKQPKCIHALNHIAELIKDDIEFGDDRMRIYEKIMNGAYGNDPIPDSKSSFENYIEYKNKKYK